MCSVSEQFPGGRDRLTDFQHAMLQMASLRPWEERVARESTRKKLCGSWTELVAEGAATLWFCE